MINSGIKSAIVSANQCTMKKNLKTKIKPYEDKINKTFMMV